MEAKRVSGNFMRGRLTGSFIRTVSVPGRYHDGLGMGLMLRVMPSGSRQWVQRLNCQGKRIEIGLGSPPVVSLAEAREKAIDNKRLVYNGHNPVSQKAALAEVPTFEEAATAAIIIQSKGKAVKYEGQFMGTLRLHAFPHIGGVKVNAVAASDLNIFLEGLIQEKPSVAKKVMENISITFNWCIGKGFVDVNPMEKARDFLPKLAVSGKHRISLHYTEVNGFLHALQGCGATPFTKLGIEFLILTAGRSGEIRGALWNEVLPVLPQWVIPKERMKSTRDHVVPLSDRAMEILELAKALREAKSSPLIFPSPNGKVLSDMTFSKLVKVSLGYEVDIHGFRTSFRTWAQEKTDFSEEACELALSHTFGGKTRNAYARSECLEERTLLMQAWADYLKIPSENHKKQV